MRMVEEHRRHSARPADDLPDAARPPGNCADYDLSSLRFAVTGAAGARGADRADAVRTRHRHRADRLRPHRRPAVSAPCAAPTTTPSRSPPPADGRSPTSNCGSIAAGEGEPGEVLLRGPNVMLGYLDDPEGHRSRHRREGWLHTGDIGTVDAAGNLRITDRLRTCTSAAGSTSTPPRSNRCWPGCRVAEAAVIGVPTNDSARWAGVHGGPRGRPRRGRPSSPTPKKHLANFKTPRSVVFLDVLPRNPGGKVVKPHCGGWFDGSDFDDVTSTTFRSRYATSLAANKGVVPHQVLRHRRGLRAAPALGQDAVRRPAVGDRLAEEVRRPRRHLLQWVVYEEEYFQRRRPGRASANGTSMLAPTLFAHGTEGTAGPDPAENGQRRGDLGAGLVGAGVRQRSGVVVHRHQDRRGWLLNGQKIWSSRAPFGDRGFGLFRSDPKPSGTRA